MEKNMLFLSKLDKTKLSKNELKVLTYIAQMQRWRSCANLKFSDIADNARVTKATAKNCTKRLEEKGLVNVKSQYFYGDKLPYNFKVVRNKDYIKKEQ